MDQWIEEMLLQEKENERLLELAEKDLAHAPDGDIRVSRRKMVPAFYQTRLSNGGGEKYLGKDQAALVAALAQKKYAQKAKLVLEEEQKVIQKVCKKELLSLNDVFYTMPEALQPLVNPYVLPTDRFVKQWKEQMEASASGEDFKSRIEVIINGYYEKLQVPHVYEPSLFLEGYGPARPDFAVLNIRTRKTFYHEHLGMMDNEKYRQKNMRKLQAYHQNGFYEGINLIITMEGDGAMIDYKEMENILRTYCL